ncbi:MAG: DUF4191 domain-containing protein [Propionibacterium sp.]|nr:DUF4191 domain-containing protein [Propionibacterium sp.]
MAKSEKAKALAAKQKAEAQAEKLRKKHSTNPDDWGRTRQMVEVYKVTKQHDPKLGLILALSFAIPFLIVLGLTIWLAWGSWISFALWSLMSVMTGFLVMMLVFTRRARKGAYKRYEDQPGAGEVALGMLNKKWHSTPGIAVTKSYDAVHRTLGPGGLILVGDGEPGRLKALLASEKKKHDQVLYGVQTQVVQLGKGDGRVPLDKLADHIKKLPKQLSPTQINETRNRLRSLDAIRPKAPIPKGPINMKGAHKAMRGR